MNVGLLLPYTEFPENLVQDVFNVNSPKQPSERLRRRPQIFRDELLPLSARGIYAALQRSRRLAQQCALPLPADQPAFVGTDIDPCEADQRRDQPVHAIAASRRNLEFLNATGLPHACRMPVKCA